MVQEIKLYTIRVVNKDSGRIDVHRNLTISEVEYIKLTPTLEVEVVEVNFKKKRHRSRRRA